ncbi:hypothetical protein D9758_007305 [Tetrapyrgos nigripes]|uniref:Peptidase S33 tripeptidyl aminopeptidase-like C-terminal domain-containing protein n=1 Tax=Tetrapyrgos nigripes TaxID=182062 RepID=A0A8H5GB12_9AGAR|nr:hypothetical protein D9758_007305 [Tetrapyrgos nigripes]
MLHSGGSQSNGLIRSDATVVIFCTDSDPSDADASQFREYMSSINSTFAGMGSLPFMIHCAGWKFHPEDRFRGPVGANTSSLLLIIGNTADPITVISGAKKANAAFPGSVLLTQDSPGHTFLTSVSNCTYRHIAAYFANGSLPDEGTVCLPDVPLFPGADLTHS